MKKTIWTIMVIIISAVVVTFVACNKESELTNNEPIRNKAKSVYVQDCSPHFLWKNINSQPCSNKPGSIFCGYNIDDVLTGDEACWLMMKDGDPFRFFLPKSLVLSSNVGVLIDSARTGAMTFHSDFEIESASMAKDLGIDLIPAGRYPAAMTMYNGDSAVCIYLDTVL
jgi:hypothetical protein